MIRALILDLDNTIFDTSSISPVIFKDLFALMDKYKNEVGAEKMEEAKTLMSKKAFQILADQYGFNEELREQGMELLRKTTYGYPIVPFTDYSFIKQVHLDKYLVTMGFEKMQQSKIRMLDLHTDFIETIVNDPDQTDETKKDVFQDIIQRNHYKAEEVLVIGDDPDSEIKAGKDLGMPTLLYDPHHEYGEDVADYRIENYKDLQKVIESIQ
ncbi:HAD family hydrolase [Mucilaginibacter robiniae]|uniref:HAD family hydrolase n=1 Tax=Mucilaginibacter robiniae TaxID=2728022 RepID=A0A7L5DY33_9SPHI|nr:HAD family hydrolase [Mucilaginibacter robiniae]QJD95017.1 HAD family hydrolase [Mucilaginibacter robiniae]